MWYINWELLFFWGYLFAAIVLFVKAIDWVSEGWNFIKKLFMHSSEKKEDASIIADYDWDDSYHP